MKDFFKSKKRFLLIILGIAVLITAGFFYSQTQSSAAPKYQEYQVKKENLVRTIEASGSLEPATDVHLAFKKGGLIKDVSAKVGDRVNKGDILAQLQNDKEAATLAQYKALLNEAQASLNLELADPTPEEIAIAQADIEQASANKEKALVNLRNARIDLENTRKTLAQDIATAELEIENARLNLDKVKINSSTTETQTSTEIQNTISSYKTAAGQLLVSLKSAMQTADKIFGIEVESVFEDKEEFYLTVFESAEFGNTRLLLGRSQSEFNTLKAQYEALPSTLTAADLESFSKNLSNFTMNINTVMLGTSNILDKVLLDQDFALQDLINLRTDITAAASSLNTSLVNYHTAKEKLDNAFINENSTIATVPLDVRTAELNLAQKEQNLEKIKVDGEVLISNKETAVLALEADLQTHDAAINKARAGLDKLMAKPRSVDLAPYQARVAQANAQVLSAQNDYNETLLLAPFSGIVTAKDVEIGQQFTTGTTAITIMDDNEFHIDVSIPETQINQISLEDKVTVAFDALGTDEELEGKILTIEPAAENVEETIYYKAKIVLTKKDPRLKPSMTADVTIQSKKAEPMLSIPEKAIFMENNVKKVRTKGGNGEIDTTAVTTGVRGDNGMIEIISGLKEGQIILYQ